MAPYTIDLHDADGSRREARTHTFAHDDEAIDHAGAIDHPHEIKVWRGERLVAHFPPVSTPPLTHPGGSRELTFGCPLG